MPAGSHPPDVAGTTPGEQPQHPSPGAPPPAGSRARLAVLALIASSACGGPPSAAPAGPPTHGHPSPERIAALCHVSTEQGLAVAAKLGCKAAVPAREEYCQLEFSVPAAARCFDLADAYIACLRPLPPSAFQCDPENIVVARPASCSATMLALKRCTSEGRPDAGDDER